MSAISRELVKESERGQVTTARFGIRFLWVESYVYDSASSLCIDYDGGLWEFYVLSNGGFYMAPRAETVYHVECANGSQGDLSSDAFGLTACLYAFSLLSFSPNQEFATLCADYYHYLRDYITPHAEAKAIWDAID